MIHINFQNPPEFPENEEQRQCAVERSRVGHRGKKAGLQRLVDEAAKLFHTPIAAVTIVDRDRQWFAVSTGLDVQQTPRDISFCAHAIHRPGEPLIVTDARRDPRFADNPLVKFAPHIRFYAGMPLLDGQGYPLGALCVIDSRPREEPANMFELSLLAREAERLIAL